MPETTIRELCELHFNTSLGRKRVVRVPDPTPGLNGAMAQSAATRFIFANPFNAETIGSLTAFVRADKVIESRIRLV